MIAYSALHWALSVWGLAMFVAALLIVVFDVAGKIARAFSPRPMPSHDELIREMFHDNPGGDLPFNAAAASQVVEHHRKGR